MHSVRSIVQGVLLAIETEEKESSIIHCVENLFIVFISMKSRALKPSTTKLYFPLAEE